MIATVIHTHELSCILADGPWCLAVFMVSCAVLMMLCWGEESRRTHRRKSSAQQWAEALDTYTLAEFVSNGSALDSEEKDAVLAEVWKRQHTDVRGGPT